MALRSAIPLALLVVACGGQSSNTGSGGTSSGGTSSGGTSSGGTSSGGTSSGGTSSGGSGGNTSCTSTSNPFANVHIELDPTARCSFTLAEAAAGISIPYAVVVDQPMSDIVPESQVTCANPGPSGLYVFEQLSGNNQSYCLCDSGLCPPPTGAPITLQPGNYPSSFEWDGKNWTGPSDYGNPKGPPFPAGTYDLHLSAKGTMAGTAFDVTLDAPITLTP